MDSIGAQAYAKILENGVQAIEEVKRLLDSGYTREDIYVISHDQDREDRIVEAAGASEVGLSEEGLFGTLANMFRSRGDELRSQISSLGFSEAEADFYEQELDLGKVLVIAKRRSS
ncbi:general stress protein [Paenibacillus sp. HN-1]|uniref:general stress protein n=1 Tax=Paenibacillus TaxID=44249 RepID=UPI001CA843F6|nr:MULTISPECIES: general stress protein [Paenibacillus]MBY9077048.1 general stress protein [Paenibacillus sp. CGMCC 1.18879]MBY9086579.1 general stress protein [Paenibacillus sinensis]